MEGNPERIVVVSLDGHLVWPVFQTIRGTEWSITPPKPGTVIISSDFLISVENELALFGVSC
jgi:hypothetical protein